VGRRTRIIGPLKVYEQYASGAGFWKGDHYDKHWLIEEKATGGKQIAVKRAWWEKIAAEALQEGKRPLLLLRFLGPGGTLELVCMSPEDWAREVGGSADQ